MRPEGLRQLNRSFPEELLLCNAVQNFVQDEQEHRKQKHLHADGNDQELHQRL